MTNRPTSRSLALRWAVVVIGLALLSCSSGAPPESGTIAGGSMDAGTGGSGGAAGRPNSTTSSGGSGGATDGGASGATGTGGKPEAGTGSPGADAMSEGGSPSADAVADGAGPTADSASDGAASPDGSVLGPPGFTGYGADTPGGRGGTVIKVTNLNASGAGSLTEAIATAGPRIVVFEVGGVIDLNQARVTINQPFLTIAGQTAPSPGITLIRGGVAVTTHDVIIQHLRVRIGDAGATPASGFEPDVTTDGPAAYNIVFDHCSVSWGVDENLSVSGPRFNGTAGTSHDVSIANSIIAEGLYQSIHSKGIHSMGTLIHDYCTNVAVVGNLYAHNDERNPWFKGFATGVIVNNVVYDSGKWAMRLGPVDSEWTTTTIVPDPPRVSVVGNYMKYGVSTPVGQTMVGTNSRGQAYVEDNVAVDTAGAAVPITSAAVVVLAQKPTWPAGLVPRTAASNPEWVLAHAGARPKDRDAVDIRLISEFRAGTGKFVNSQNDVGGYPMATPTQRVLTVPAQNIEGWLNDFAVALE